MCPRSEAVVLVVFSLRALRHLGEIDVVAAPAPLDEAVQLFAAQAGVGFALA